MTKQEEQLWNYIDGFCSLKEQAEIESKLAEDQSLMDLYEQLLMVNQQLNTHLEIDEPSMSFTRNVMEQVKHEIAPVAIKTKVDHRIIYTIGGFFTVVLLGALIYAFATVTPDVKIKTLTSTVRLDIEIRPTVLWVVLFANAVLLLIYLDSYLRKGMKKAQKKGEQ